MTFIPKGIPVTNVKEVVLLSIRLFRAGPPLASIVILCELGNGASSGWWRPMWQLVGQVGGAKTGFQPLPPWPQCTVQQLYAAAPVRLKI